MTFVNTLLLVGFIVGLFAIVADPIRAIQTKIDARVLPLLRRLYASPWTGAKSGPKTIEFKMTGVEKPIVLDDAGTTTRRLTHGRFNSRAAQIVHEGDMSKDAINPASNMMTHTIDFHAAYRSTGGATLMQVNPGEQAGAALESNARWCVPLSLRTRRIDDAVACHIGHEWGGAWFCRRGSEG